MLNEEIHPSWPNEPPKVVDKLPEPKPEKKRCLNSVCKHYYNKCFNRIKQK